jgi:flagellar biosynthesis/type III secretory pathway protein FliH
VGATDAHTRNRIVEEVTDYDPRDPEDVYQQGYRQGYSDGYRDGRQAKEEEAFTPRRIRRPLADYERIAEVYQNAYEQGMSLHATVAQEMGVKRSQAGALIQAARERGLLPPTHRGKAAAWPQ